MTERAGDDLTRSGADRWAWADRENLGRAIDAALGHADLDVVTDLGVLLLKVLEPSRDNTEFWSC